MSMTLSRLGMLDFCLMVEIFNRAWLGMDEMINLSDDADLCWGIAGCAGEYCQLLLGKNRLAGGRELVADSLEAWLDLILDPEVL